MVRKSAQALFTLAVCMAFSGVLHADSFLVENLNDSGAGSLRDAITSANAAQGPHTIDFNDGLSGTIVLSSGLPQLTGDMEIIGPSAEIITVSGNSLYQPFFVSSTGTVTISGLTIADGRSNIGGGIANEGDLTVTDCVLSNNHANTDGGAIDNFGGSLVVNQSRLSCNSVGEGGAGGGISNAGSGTVSIIESTLSGNTAGSSSTGGAVDNTSGSTATIVRSTLSANGADWGGAVENAGTLILRNSTLSGNVAIETGGGIDNYTGGAATVDFSTLTENSADSGGGIENVASMSIKHSLVVNSSAGNNCFNGAGATFNALGVNFATDASCTGFTQATAGEINLGPLADYGGPTQTHALLSGSEAVDAAVNCTLSDGTTTVTQDQRGQARPDGAYCDSGSFEGIASLPAIIFGNGFECK